MLRLLLVLTCALIAALAAAAGTPDTPVGRPAPYPLRIVLPKDIYAVPGREINVYLDNIILVPNVKNYLFDVTCAKGRQDEERWRYTPAADEKGDFPFSIKVLDGLMNVLAEASATLHVTPADAGAGKEISLLIVGDSLTHASVYPEEIWNLFKAPGNPKLKLIGTFHPIPSQPPEIVHEGYGGWRWETFCTQWNTLPQDNRGPSPFIHLVDGKPVLDFKWYCDKVNGGKAPDFITVFLGCNDNFGATEDTIESSIDRMFTFADKLLAEFRRVGPQTQIGLLLLTPPAATQDAFGSNYTCGQTRWQYRRNQHRVVERMMQKFAGHETEGIWLIPSHINLDTVNNYPVSVEPLSARNATKVSRLANGVHPSGPGYLQIADSVYCWLKSRLR